MRLRRPFFPPAAYAHIASGLAEEFELLPPAPEGHISPDQAEFLYHLVRLIRPALVVETGFCVGHSALTVLYAQQSVGIGPRVVSIDNCQFSETKPAAARLKGKYEHFDLIEGDSKVVLVDGVNRYLREHEGLAVGLGIIDGGHDLETTSHDLEALASFLPVGAYLWLDDFEKIVTNPWVNRAGREFARKWGSCHRFRTDDTRGFMIYQKAF